MLGSAVTTKANLQAKAPILWADGWYAKAQACPSPNFGPRPAGMAVDLVVIHAISLPPGQYGGGQVQDFFLNRLDCTAHPYFGPLKNVKVSAHFFIERTGLLWQLVSADQRAWHAGQSSYQGRENCNDFSIGIELEGLPGEAFEAAQYKTLKTLCEDLLLQYPIQAMVGHEHIAPGRKDDPGPGFDWEGLKKALAGFPGLGYLF